MFSMQEPEADKIVSCNYWVLVRGSKKLCGTSRARKKALVVFTNQKIAENFCSDNGIKEIEMKCFSRQELAEVFGQECSVLCVNPAKMLVVNPCLEAI